MATFTRPDQVNSSGNDDVNYQEKVEGELLASFMKDSETAGFGMEKAANGYIAVKFRNMGRTTAAFKPAPGTDIISTAIPFKETVILVAPPLYAATYEDDWDKLRDTFELRSPIVKELSDAIVRQYDKWSYLAMYKAALTGSQVAGRAGGSVLYDVQIDDVDNLVEQLRLGQVAMNKKEVPKEGRRAYFAPDQYSMLCMHPMATNKFFTDDNGSIKEGDTKRLFGWDLHEAVRLPQEVVGDETDIDSQLGRFTGDYTDVAGVLVHDLAIARAVSTGMIFEDERLANKGSWFVSARKSEGLGVLRPEASILLRTSAAP